MSSINWEKRRKWMNDLYQKGEGMEIEDQEK